MRGEAESGKDSIVICAMLFAHLGNCIFSLTHPIHKKQHSYIFHCMSFSLMFPDLFLFCFRASFNILL